MNKLCQQCGKVIARGGYPIGGGRTACRYCAVRATGLTTTALRAAHGARIAGENYRKRIASLKAKIATYERLETSRRERVEFLEDQIAEMLNDKQTYEREMQKHGNK